MPDRYFFVFDNALAKPGDRPFTAAIYEGDPPTPSMLKQLPPVLGKWRLEGRWAEMSLGEIVAEYELRAAAGRVPPTNMVPPPKAEGRKPEGRLTPRAEIEAMVARPRAASQARKS